MFEDDILLTLYYISVVSVLIIDSNI